MELPLGPFDDLPDGFPRPVVIVADYEFHTERVALAQLDREVPPSAARLPMSQLDTQDLALAVPVDADDNQHGTGVDDAAFPTSYR